MSEESELIKGASRVGTVWGIAVMIMGFLAIGAPMAFGLTATVVVAALVLASGIAQTVYAFQAESFGKGVLKFVFGGITALCGLAMLIWPGDALAGLTLFLAAYFLVDGASAIVAAFHLRPASGWGWMLFSGGMTVVLGGLIAAEWPFSGVWAIGVLLGIRLIFAGWSMVAVGALGEAVGTKLEQAG
jgi:uncharacterized membrane protein HdeD (DUF308 family)